MKVEVTRRYHDVGIDEEQRLGERKKKLRLTVQKMMGNCHFSQFPQYKTIQHVVLYRAQSCGRKIGGRHT